MGQGYSYRCENCNYLIEYLQGVGFMFFIEAEKILADMQSGKMGKQFMKMSNEASTPGVVHSRELYKCDDCGELRPDMKVELRDAGKLLLEKQHRCGKCRAKMRVVEENEKIKCPNCGKPLVIGDMLLWD